jgi:hypothetical protein
MHLRTRIISSARCVYGFPEKLVISTVFFTLTAVWRRRIRWVRYSRPPSLLQFSTCVKIRLAYSPLENKPPCSEEPYMVNDNTHSRCVPSVSQKPSKSPKYDCAYTSHWFSFFSLLIFNVGSTHRSTLGLPSSRYVYSRVLARESLNFTQLTDHSVNAL